MIMFLIIVNYGKLWQTFGEGHRDPCQYLANTVMMITWKTFHIQLRLTTCQTLHWLHTTWEQRGIGSLKTSENNLVTQLYVKLETKVREESSRSLDQHGEGPYQGLLLAESGQQHSAFIFKNLLRHYAKQADTKIFTHGRLQHAQCLGIVLNVKVAFNQEKALVGACSVIVKSSRTFFSSSSCVSPCS